LISLENIRLEDPVHCFILNLKI